MFSFLMKKAAVWFAKKQESQDPPAHHPREQIPISQSLEENLRAIKHAVGDSGDVIIKEFVIKNNPGSKAAVVCVDGLVDSKTIHESIIRPLMYEAKPWDIQRERERQGKGDTLKELQETMLVASEVKEVSTIEEAIQGFLSGDTLLLVDGVAKALVIGSKGWDKRGVDEPASEAVIRGPRESFVENLRTNTALLRRKIKNPNLTFEMMILGQRTKTNVVIAYIRGLAKPELVEKVKQRMQAIETDSILESGYIEQYIEDSHASIFATLGYTEKPDVAAAKILEGRVAIIVDGTPFVLTAPLLFIEHFQSAEDYYFRPYFTTLLRVIRFIAAAIAILAPALYVAIATFHQELIPTDLFLTMARAREGVPFPAFIESLIMILTFEILREAGIRLPRPVGQALSIVGALVVGESAVSAGLIGAPMVIVVAITAVSGFVVPNLADTGAVLRLILLVLAGTFGGYGITLGLLATLMHMASLESFGFDYLAPFAPFDFEDSKDAVIRAPLWLMINRPKGMALDKQRKKVMDPKNHQEKKGTSK